MSDTRPGPEPASEPASDPASDPGVEPAYEPTDHVGAVVAADGLTVWVAGLPGGPIHVLEGVAASIWTAATSTPAEAWRTRVAAEWEQSADIVAEQVDAFVDDLVARGLLRPAGRPAG